MNCSTEDLIEQFYNTIKDLYPSLSLADVTNICRGPFYYIRSRMEDITFPTIHIKYLGKFLVYPAKAKHLLASAHKSFESGVMSKVDYEKHTTNLNKFITDNVKIPKANIK